MYKANHKLLPRNLQRLLVINSDRHYVTRQTNKIEQVYARTTLKSQCISIYGIQLRNSQKCNIQRARALLLFQRLPKKDLLQGYHTILDDLICTIRENVLCDDFFYFFL